LDSETVVFIIHAARMIPRSCHSEWDALGSEIRRSDEIALCRLPGEDFVEAASVSHVIALRGGSEFATVKGRKGGLSFVANARCRCELVLYGHLAGTGQR
jgi:hypothetical protein